LEYNARETRVTQRQQQVAQRGDESRGARCLKLTCAGAQVVLDEHGGTVCAGMCCGGVLYRAVLGRPCLSPRVGINRVEASVAVRSGGGVMGIIMEDVSSGVLRQPIASTGSSRGAIGRIAAPKNTL
jgi:hypothetical protein